MGIDQGPVNLIRMSPPFVRIQILTLRVIMASTVEPAMSSQPQPFKPSRCIKASFYIPENRPNFPTTRGFRKKIPMKLVYQYMAIFFNFSPTSSHLHSLQVENCNSNSRLVVDEDDNGKFRLERVKTEKLWTFKIGGLFV